MGRRHREERGPRQGSPSLASEEFAEEAHEHIALFDHETRQQIQEYCELVARLPYDDDAPLGV